jgi:hypothetical protein
MIFLLGIGVGFVLTSGLALIVAGLDENDLIY